MSTTITSEPEASTATVEDIIANLPENEVESAKVLLEMRGKEETARDKIDSNLYLIKRKLDEVLKRSLEKNMKPDERLLAGIRDRYALSSGFDVDRSDFDTVLGEIEDNNGMLNHIRRAEIAFGAQWTIVSISDSEIQLMDTVEETNVAAQEQFLSDVDEKEKADAVQRLLERFPNIEQYLERADDEEGLHYYDYLVVCEITGAEPMSEEQYRKLQEIKPVDREKICWLLTDKARLDRGSALFGGRYGAGVSVSGDCADVRDFLRAGRPLLRVKRI